MKKIIKFLFKKYRREFDSFYIEDMFGNIPREVTDNALKFMLTGKKDLDRWIRWQAYVCQRKLIEIKTGGIYISTLVILKTLSTALARMETEKRLFPPDELEEVTTILDELKNVDEFEKGRPKEQDKK